jgi:hypothetical protein
MERLMITNGSLIMYCPNIHDSQSYFKKRTTGTTNISGMVNAAWYNRNKNCHSMMHQFTI